jgi:hypothetical protein
MRPCARWLLSLTLTALVLTVWPGRAQANPLDPTSFTSLGANPSNPANTPSLFRTFGDASCAGRLQ